MLEELHSRTADGLTVALQYDKDENALFLELLDEAGLTLIPIPNDKGMEAFYHPYCFVPISSAPPVYQGTE